MNALTLSYEKLEAWSSFTVGRGTAAAEPMTEGHEYLRYAFLGANLLGASKPEPNKARLEPSVCVVFIVVFAVLEYLRHSDLIVFAGSRVF